MGEGHTRTLYFPLSFPETKNCSKSKVWERNRNGARSGSARAGPTPSKGLSCGAADASRVTLANPAEEHSPHRRRPGDEAERPFVRGQAGVVQFVAGVCRRGLPPGCGSLGCYWSSRENRMRCENRGIRP